MNKADQFVLKNIRLARMIANKLRSQRWFRQQVDDEDAVQECVIVMLETCRRPDFNFDMHPNQLASYLCLAMYRRVARKAFEQSLVRSAVNGKKKLPILTHTVGFLADPGANGGNINYPTNERYNPFFGVLAPEPTEEVELECLSQRERAVVEGKFALTGKELSFRELGKVLRAKPESVSRIFKRAMDKLREVYCG